MDKTSKDGEKLTKEEEKVFATFGCPDCGTDDLQEGPHGGLSVNYQCPNEECGSRFNHMGPFGVVRISDASPNKLKDPPITTTPYRD
jgi:hypothetical protein